MDTAAISAITALVAVIVSPMISVYVAKKQFGGSVLSKFRQEWINSLRDSISEYISCVFMITLFIKTSMTIKDAEFKQKVDRLIYLDQKINLMINTGEEKHNKLAGLMNELTGVISEVDHKKTTGVLQDKSKEIIELSKEILKTEWNRVKKGN